MKVLIVNTSECIGGGTVAAKGMFGRIVFPY